MTFYVTIYLRIFIIFFFFNWQKWASYTSQSWHELHSEEVQHTLIHKYRSVLTCWEAHKRLLRTCLLSQCESALIYIAHMHECKQTDKHTQTQICHTHCNIHPFQPVSVTMQYCRLYILGVSPAPGLPCQQWLHSPCYIYNGNKNMALGLGNI